MQVLRGIDDGKIIQEARLAKGWSRSNLAQAYGHFFHDEAISEDTVRMWEEHNKVPKKPKRRQVLAILLDIPVVALGIEPLATFALKASDLVNERRIDLVTATIQLQHYKQQNHSSTVGPLLTDILETIRRIHDEIPYLSAGKRTQLLELLCDYQQFVASIYKDHSQYDQALSHQNKAYAVAKTLQDPEQIALALWRRGLTYDAQGNVQAAISDFLAAQRYQTQSIHLEGVLWQSLGHVQAHHATHRTEQKEAFRSFDEAEVRLDQAEGALDPHFIKFNREGYFLSRASAWVGSPVRELRSSSHALDMLTLVPVDESRKRRYSYSSYLQARAWFESGELPMATQTALDALTVAGPIHSQLRIDRIHELYQDLKETPYGKTPEVAELGAELLRNQNPGLFL